MFPLSCLSFTLLDSESSEHNSTAGPGSLHWNYLGPSLADTTGSLYTYDYPLPMCFSVHRGWAGRNNTRTPFQLSPGFTEQRHPQDNRGQCCHRLWWLCSGESGLPTCTRAKLFIWTAARYILLSVPGVLSPNGYR